ncbi:hypothetical protein [Anatilimnocola floriformis]|uniref:hypothetical protein n=1 Tax=Anatilimnocola floriformis TaxID=2948575 RepID=UPI0020C26BAE|nr:hypothetical protein [Anatilimnocola floriformis]
MKSICHLNCLLALLLLVGCGASNDDRQAVARVPVPTNAQTAKEAVQPVGTPPGVPATQRAAREMITSAPLDIARDASFTDFSQRFAKARKEQKTLPDGSAELDRLYHLVVSRGFQGAANSQEVDQQLQKWLQADNSDPAPQLAIARASLNQAYTARGAVYGDIVSQKKKERFVLLLTDAHRRAAEALEQGIEDPEAFRLFVQSGLELEMPPQLLRPTIEQAVRLAPKYYPLYDLLAKLSQEGTEIDGKLPQFARLAREALADHPGDEGLEIYTRIARAANRVDRRTILRSGFDLAKLNAGCKLLLQRYPQAADLIDFIGVVAYLTEDRALAQEVLPELTARKPSMDDWGEEAHWRNFQEFAKTTAPRDQAARLIWPGPAGVSAMVFVDQGRYVVTTGGDRNQDALCVWPMADENFGEPHHVRIDEPMGWQLDVDRQGDCLLVYDVGRHSLITRIFRLSAEPVPQKFSKVVWYRPRIEATTVNPLSGPANSRRGFFEISEDGKVAVAYLGGDVEVFDPATAKKLKSFNVGDAYSSIESKTRHLSPDGKLLALQAQERIEIWDCEQGTKVSEISEKMVRTEFLMGFGGLLPDHSALFRSRKRTSGTSDLTLSVFDLETQEMRKLGLLERRDQPMAILGNELVACGPDRSAHQPEINIYRLRDGKKIHSIQGHADKALIKGRFSPDGSWLATWDQHGPVRLWKIPAADAPSP